MRTMSYVAEMEPTVLRNSRKTRSPESVLLVTKRAFGIALRYVPGCAGSYSDCERLTI